MEPRLNWCSIVRNTIRYSRSPASLISGLLTAKCEFCVTH